MRTIAIFGAIVAILATAGSSASLAQTTDDKGFSIELQAFDAKSQDFVSDFKLDDKRAGTAISGAYALNKFVALHAAYSDYGSHFASDCPGPAICVTQNVDQVDLSALSVGVSGIWPVTRLVELYGTVGLANWSADFVNFDRDESDRDLVVGVGISARIRPDWRISLKYEQIDRLELDSLGLALAYQF
jgi:hypothetical protein